MKWFIALIIIIVLALVIVWFLQAPAPEEGPAEQEEPAAQPEEPSPEPTIMNLTLSSTAFEHEGTIPSKYTCDGEDINPPLKIEGVPEGTQSLTLIVDDPDAPAGTWVHWILFGMSPEVTEIPENTVPESASEGVNSWDKHEYGGPCPPSGTHRYFFKLYALDTKLALAAGATKAELEQAMEGHILAETVLMGTYERD